MTNTSFFFFLDVNFQSPSTEHLLNGASFTHSPATIKTSGISYFSLKSVTTRMKNSKAISHQISGVKHVAHTLSTDLSLGELEVPMHNHRSISINPNRPSEGVKGAAQGTIQTEARGSSSPIYKPAQGYAQHTGGFAASVTRAITVLPEKPESTKLSRCAESPCFVGASCVPATGGHFPCGRCPLGYFGDGISCRGSVKTLQKVQRKLSSSH